MLKPITKSRSTSSTASRVRYRRLPKGYVVYSIGRDLTDDGGKVPPADPKPDDRHDLTFTVERLD